MTATMTSEARFWDKIAEKYAKSPIRDMESYEYTLGRTRSYLSATDQVLELGCGTGSTALRLVDAVDRLVASDISEGMLEVGRRRAAEQGAPNVGFVRAAPGDAPEGPFDVVMGFNLFHLVEDLDGALADVAARVKPGGLFISKTPCIGERIGAVKFRLMKLAIPLLQMIGKAPFVHFLTIRDWEAAVTRAGFEIVECGNYPVDPPSRYLVARKR